jgi:hypothetical protein
MCNPQGPPPKRNHLIVATPCLAQDSPGTAGTRREHSASPHEPACSGGPSIIRGFQSHITQLTTDLLHLAGHAPDRGRATRQGASRRSFPSRRGTCREDGGPSGYTAVTFTNSGLRDLPSRHTSLAAELGALLTAGRLNWRWRYEDDPWKTGVRKVSPAANERDGAGQSR